ncbi:hypothetical protein PG993_013815 [Apiospora rasikravindrae]|uniref:Uncharacterized protein n=1 Tax=Apiospora rasikravindrae TaxID=990691 RepID=A0ABR1RR84_9PEZI
MENDRKTAVHKEKEDAITPAPTATHSLAQEKEAGEPKIAQIVNYFKEGQSITVKQHQRIATYYRQRAEANHIAPSADIEYVLNQILSMNEDEAVRILVGAIAHHNDDPNFPAATLVRMRRIVTGSRANCNGGNAATPMDPGEPAEAGITAPITKEDCAFELKTEAAIYYHHSPYPEVRSVAIPGNNPSTPFKTVRAYFLRISFIKKRTGFLIFNKI